MADFASIAPRSQDAVPSLLPQPKLNVGAPAAGDTASLRVESGTFPPVVQALMIHRAVSPRLLVDCERVTATQSLTATAACGAFGVEVAELTVALGVGETLALGSAVLEVGCAWGDLLGDPEGDALPDAEPDALPDTLGVGELGVGDGLCVGVGVGFGLAELCGAGVGVGVAELGIAADCSMTPPPRPRPKVAPDVTLVLALGDGDGDGLVAVAVGVGFAVGVAVGVGDGLGRGAGSLSGSHDVWLADALLPAAAGMT